MRKIGSSIILSFFGLLIVLGPLSSISLALPSTNTNNIPHNGLQVTLNWVNECTISGSISSGTNSEKLNLFDPSCIQDWKQNGNASNKPAFSDATTCQTSKIWANPYEPGNAVDQGTLYYVKSGTSNGCTAINYTSSNKINIGSTGNADIVYALNGNTISRVDNNPYYVFTQSSSNPSLYTLNSGSTCNDTILLNGGNSAQLWEITSTGSGSFYPSNKTVPANIDASGCVVSYADDDINGPTASGAADHSGGSSANICTTNNSASAQYCSDHPQNSDGSFNLNLGTASNLSPGSGSGGSQNPTSASSSCESSNFVISWIVCGAINLISKAEQSIESLVGNLLKTQPFIFNANANCTDSTASCSTQKIDAAIYSVWSNFRIYGDILMVVALLVIVISEAVGGGLIDAYTVRKVLPRILAAAVLINLSIYIIAGLEDIFNILGSGIIYLIEAPFKSAAGGLSSAVNISGSGAAGFSLGVVALVGLPLLIPGFIGILLLVVLMAFLAAIGVLVTITIRQGLLVFLLMVSPVAFALYILPNTEKYFRQWLQLTIKTLAVYPIVMAVFGISFVSGVIMSNLANGKDQMITQTMALLAIVAPIFLIPFAFRMSGGVIGAVQNGLSKFSKQVNKPLRHAASNQMARGFNKTLSGNRFAGGNETNRRGALNRRLQKIATIGTGRAGFNVFNPRGLSANAESVIAGVRSGEEEAMEKDREYIWSSDDEINKAATESVNEAGFRRKLQEFDAGRAEKRWANPAMVDQAAAQVERIRRRYSAQTFRSITQMHATAGGTAYDGETGAGDMLADIVAAARGDDVQLRHLIGQNKRLATASGRPEYNASFGTFLTEAAKMQEEIKATGQVSRESRIAANKKIIQSAKKSLSVGEATRLKPQAAVHLAEAHAETAIDLTEKIRLENLKLNEAASSPEDIKTYESNIEALQTQLDEELAATMGLADYLSAAPPEVASAYRSKLLEAKVTSPFDGQQVSIFDLANSPKINSREAFKQLRSAMAQRLAQQQTMMDIGGMTGNQSAPEGPTPPSSPGGSS